jgi:hypothetical protein
MKLYIRAPHVIHNVITKWNIQLLYILEVIPFLRHVTFEFY